MKQICFKLLLISFLVITSFTRLLAQPGPASIRYNHLFFRSDSGVFVNNFLYTTYRDMGSPYKNSGGHIIRWQGHFYPVTISKENIISTDSIFCLVQIQLIYQEDTMNIFVDNLIKKFIKKGIKYGSYIRYSLGYIPFHKGNYYVELLKPDEFFWYGDEYKFTTANLGGYGKIPEVWDIAPRNWEELRISGTPASVKKKQEYLEKIMGLFRFFFLW